MDSTFPSGVHLLPSRLQTVICRLQTVIKRVQTVIKRVQTVIKRVQTVIKKVQTVIKRVQTVIKRIQTVIKREHLREHLRERSTSPNSTDFAPKNAKSEKALNIIYRNKDFSNKEKRNNNNKEDFYFSSPFLKNSILSIFKEEYNESRGMDYIVLNEQKELSSIQGLLTAYLRQNGNSEYTGEKILDEFRAYFKKCLRIQNNFYKTNLSLSLIANKFNEIMQVIKKEGIEDPEVEAISREEFYNNLSLD